MKFLHKLISEIEPPNWVMAIMALVLLTRIPSFFEPYFYGDEMIYLTLGNAVRHGLTLYKQIHDNKPPLLYLTAAVAGNLFWFKAILAFWMLGTIIAFWHLTKELFKENSLAQKVSIIIFAVLTTIPLFEGNIVNAELFLIGPIILAFVYLLAKPTYRNIFLSGLLFAVAALFKIPGAIDLPVIVIFWLITIEKVNLKNLFEIIKKGIVLAIGFAIPMLATFAWYCAKGALNDFVKAAFLENLGYISSWGGNTNTSFLVKHGPLLIRTGLVVIGFIVLRVFNKRLGKTFTFASIWFLTSLFAVTLSGRPYPHYMIQAIPSISILAGILVGSDKFEEVLTIIPLTLAILVPVYYKFFYYSTSTYYSNFALFATKQISKWDYFDKFNENTEDNYKTSEIVMKLTGNNDRIFVWGEDAPAIYALSRRLPSIKYTADYHITDFSSLKETANNLEANPPSVIVFFPKSPKFNELDNLLSSKYVQITSGTDSEIWHLLFH